MVLNNIIENPSQQEDVQILAENLKNLLKSRGLNAHQLGRLLGIPMITIRRLLSGKTTDPRISTLKMIADYFNVSLDSLLSANAEKFLNKISRSKPHFVPKLDWVNIEQSSFIKDIDTSTWKEWQPLSLKENEQISPYAFALESRPSMYPRFPYGTVFIIDPDVIPNDGDTVLIKLRANNQLTLRELIIDPPEWQLHPIVPGSSIMPYSKDIHEIVGVNLLTMLYNRKNYN